MFCIHNTPFDLEPKTEHGIDVLELMVKFMPLCAGDDSTDIELELPKVKLWLEEQIKRTLTDREYQLMLQGIVDYLRSEPATNERETAMKFLFEAKFILSHE